MDEGEGKNYIFSSLIIYFIEWIANHNFYPHPKLSLSCHILRIFPYLHIKKIHIILLFIRIAKKLNKVQSHRLFLAEAQSTRPNLWCLQ